MIVACAGTARPIRNTRKTPATRRLRDRTIAYAARKASSTVSAALETVTIAVLIRYRVKPDRRRRRSCRR